MFFTACGSIKRYLDETSIDSIEKKVLEFAIAEAMREEDSWLLFRKVITEKVAHNRSVLEILVT